MVPVARSAPVTATTAPSEVLLCETAASLRSALGTSDTSKEDRFRGRLGIGRIEYLPDVCYPMPECYVDGGHFPGKRLDNDVDNGYGLWYVRNAARY